MGEIMISDGLRSSTRAKERTNRFNVIGSRGFSSSGSRSSRSSNLSSSGSIGGSSSRNGDRNSDRHCLLRTSSLSSGRIRGRGRGNSGGSSSRGRGFGSSGSYNLSRIGSGGPIEGGSSRCAKEDSRLHNNA